MLDVKTIRKKRSNYPDKFRRINDTFLEEAGAMVENQAVLNAPRKTGDLKGSINHRVEGDVAIVGTNLEYAPYVEYGTRRMRAQPYLRPALDQNRRNLTQLYEDTILRVFRGK